MSPLVYTKLGPADVRVPELLGDIGEVCRGRCPHGHEIVAPPEFIRFLHCGPGYVSADGSGRGHEFRPARLDDVMVNTVPVFAQVMPCNFTASSGLPIR